MPGRRRVPLRPLGGRMRKRRPRLHRDRKSGADDRSGVRAHNPGPASLPLPRQQADDPAKWTQSVGTAPCSFAARSPPGRSSGSACSGRTAGRCSTTSGSGLAPSGSPPSSSAASCCAAPRSCPEGSSSRSEDRRVYRPAAAGSHSVDPWAQRRRGRSGIRQWQPRRHRAAEPSGRRHPGLGDIPVRDAAQNTPLLVRWRFPDGA